MTISTPVKIVALGALAIALGMGGLLMLHKSATANSSSTVTPPPVVHHTTPAAAPTPAPKPKPHKPAVVLTPGLPTMVAAALKKRPVAVVAIYSPKNATDRSVLAEARAGAHEAHARFVAANVVHESIATGIETWAGTSDAPAVLVVRRPGKIVFEVSGLTDRATIAQAATTSR
jgi:hypothetical protein